MICESCGREIIDLRSGSRFDVFGRRVHRKPCNGIPLHVEVGREVELFRMRAGKRTSIKAGAR